MSYELVGLLLEVYNNASRRGVPWRYLAFLSIPLLPTPLVMLNNWNGMALLISKVISFGVDSQDPTILAVERETGSYPGSTDNNGVRSIEAQLLNG